MVKTVEYFAYGSNLSLKQMKERGIKVIDSKIAELPEWKLTFTIHSQNWGGGVGDIIPKRDHVLEGVIYTIPKENLENLDHYEGREIDDDMELGMYRKQHIPVKTSNGWNTVLTYLVNRTEEYRSKTYIKPSEDYMDTIISGAREHGLSEKYISYLEDIECV